MIINLCGQWTANCRAEGQHCSAVSTLRPAGLSGLARTRSDPPSQVIKEDAGWCVENAQGLYRNRLKEVAGIIIIIIIIIYLYSRVAGVGWRHGDTALLTQERRSSTVCSAHADASTTKHWQSHSDVPRRLSAHAAAVAGQARRTPGVRGSRAAGCPAQRASNEAVQDGRRQQRNGVEDDEVGHVVDAIFTASQCERTGRDGTTVVQLLRHRRRQYQPRGTVDDAGGPETENDAAGTAHCVCCLRSHWMTDSDVPETPNKITTALTRLSSTCHLLSGYIVLSTLRPIRPTSFMGENWLTSSALIWRN